MSDSSGEIIRVGNKERDGINVRLWMVEHGQMYSHWITQNYDIEDKPAETTEAAGVSLQPNIYLNLAAAGVEISAKPPATAPNVESEILSVSDLNANAIRAEILAIHYEKGPGPEAA